MINPSVSKSPITAHLCLGSNIGNSKKHLFHAIIDLNAHQYVSVVKISKLYISKPVDGSKQANFYNIAVQIRTELSPTSLLSICKSIETQHQRTYSYHWGPRTLDVDIAEYDDQVINMPILNIPHKEIENRDFFIQPLMDINPALHISNLGCVTTLPLPPKNIEYFESFDMISH